MEASTGTQEALSCIHLLKIQCKDGREAQNETIKKEHESMKIRSEKLKPQKYQSQ